jgi:hypothetical protein
MASIEAFDVEPIDAAHSDAVWPLSIEAGWNQNVADWRFMLGAGRGFGCVGPDGKWQASSLVLPLGQKLAWISMVLVTRSGGAAASARPAETLHRRGAVGRRGRRPRCDGAGRPIYLPLGFRDLYAIARWHFDAARRGQFAARGDLLRPIRAADLPRLALYDRPLTGMERPAILAHLALRQPGRAWIAEDAAGKIVGFVLGREGRMATSLGPVVADNEADRAGPDRQGGASAPGPFIIDVPVAHRTVRAWLEGRGSDAARLHAMTLGEAKGLDDPSHVFALAGPELG